MLKFNSVPEGYHDNVVLTNVIVVNIEYDKYGVKLEAPEKELRLTFQVLEGGDVELIIREDGE